MIPWMLCRSTFSSSLALLHDMCCSDHLLSDSKKLRQRVACDMEVACKAVQELGTSRDCLVLESCLLPLSHSMPKKAFKHLEAVVTKTIIHRKRALSKDSSHASLQSVPAEALSRICSHLLPADLGSLCCTCRCVQARLALRTDCECCHAFHKLYSCCEELWLYAHGNGVSGLGEGAVSLPAGICEPSCLKRSSCGCTI
jgi:hypothetical protein